MKNEINIKVIENAIEELLNSLAKILKSLY